MPNATRALHKPEDSQGYQEPQADGLPREQQIRERAYEIWLQRDGQPGSDVDDWCEAEQAVVGETTTQTKAAHG